MKLRIISLALFALLTSALFAQNGNAAAPAGPAPSKIGVINIQGAIISTNQGKRDFDVLTKKFEPKRNELAQLNEEVEKLKKDLQDKQDKLSDEEKNSRARIIEKKSKDLQRQLDDAQSDFNQQLNEVAAAIGNKMLDIIDKYARQNGIAMVLDVSNQQTSQVLWAHEAINITPDIVTAYNTASGVEAPPPSAPGAAKPAAKPAVKPPASTTTPAPKKP